MSMRLDYRKVAPDALQSLYALNGYLDGARIDQGLRRFVELRVAQINGCRYCIWSHSKQARELNEPEKRIAAVADWRAADCFAPGEQAALEWTEAVTRIADGAPDEALLAELRRHYDDREIYELTVAAANMNALTRIGISFGLEPPE